MAPIAFRASFLWGSVWRRFWPCTARPAPGMSEPEAVAVHLEDMDMVGEAVEECAGQPLRAEHARPLVEWQIAGDQRTAALVALAENLEQQFGPGWRERHVAEFVDDQQLVSSELTLEPQEPFLITRLEQFVNAAGLVHELIEARDEKRLLRLQRQLAAYKLLIIDELGFIPLSQTGAELLSCAASALS